MTRSLKSLAKSADNRIFCAGNNTAPPRKMTGLFSQLTPEQREYALNYKGSTNHGDPAFLIKNRVP